MNRSLYLMRHAKSDWDASYAHDRERPLNERGRAAAAKMGAWLTTEGEAPELVLVSPAVRTQETCELAREAGEWDAGIETVDAFYEASVDTILARISEVPEDVERVLVLGHMPTMAAVVTRLTRQRPREFPTAACARIDGAKLVWLVTPSSLKK